MNFLDSRFKDKSQSVLSLFSLSQSPTKIMGEHKPQLTDIFPRGNNEELTSPDEVFLLSDIYEGSKLNPEAQEFVPSPELTSEKYISENLGNENCSFPTQNLIWDKSVDWCEFMNSINLSNDMQDQNLISSFESYSSVHQIIEDKSDKFNSSEVKKFTTESFSVSQSISSFSKFCTTEILSEIGVNKIDKIQPLVNLECRSDKMNETESFNIPILVRKQKNMSLSSEPSEADDFIVFETNEEVLDRSSDIEEESEEEDEDSDDSDIEWEKNGCEEEETGSEDDEDSDENSNCGEDEGSQKSFIVFEEDDDCSQRSFIIFEEEKDQQCEDDDASFFVLDDDWPGVGGALQISAMFTPSVDLCDGSSFAVSASLLTILDPEVVDANRRWKEHIDKDITTSTPARVNFCSSPPIEFEIDFWDRKGEWEMYARDRMRFRRRIEETEHVLSKILNSTHRQNIYKKLEAE